MPLTERGQFRSALAMLAEEPSIGLGDCELARRLLPNMTDKLARGRRLQAALRQAIAHLATMRGSWCYIVYVMEYEEGVSRQQVCQRLHISDSTCTRAKRIGLKRIMDELPYLLQSERAVGA